MAGLEDLIRSSAPGGSRAGKAQVNSHRSPECFIAPTAATITGVAGRCNVTLAATPCCGKSINKERANGSASASRIESKQIPWYRPHHPFDWVRLPII